MASKTIDKKPAFVMTVGDLADYLRVHRSTIYRLLRNREIPAFRIGSDWRFNREAIDQWQMKATINSRG